MKKIHLEETIHAPREKVWNTLTGDATYRIWTSAFQEGSFFEGSWEKGDRIRFLMINKEGQKEGMVSEIAESIYPEFISIRHLGCVVKGVDDTSSDEVKKWAPSYENYKLEEIAGDTTRFIVEMDISEEYYDMFLKLWTKAFSLLKPLCESTEHQS